MHHFDLEATRARLPLAPLIAALRQMFIAGCEVPPRHVHSIGAAEGGSAGTLLVMPAWRPGRHLGIKIVSVYPGNAARGLPGLHGVYTLLDAATGVPLAQMDGMELTTRRTVAASALAASFLARPEARRLVIVGAGRVAHLIAQAHRVVRPGLAEVQVWARRAEAAMPLVAQLRDEGFAASLCTDLPGAVAHADIVSCATLAAQPLVQGAWLRPGVHLDLIGSFTPAMRESDGACLARTRVYVDTEEALVKSGDLVQAMAEGAFDAQALQGTLAQLCRGERAGRGADDEITLFKSVGNALEDLAAAELVVASR